MLLNGEGFANFVAEFRAHSESRIAFDFETTGLHPKAGARAFLLGVSHRSLGEVATLLDEIDPRLVQDFVGREDATYAAHNAKFEMWFLKEQFDADIAGKVWDTQVFERVVRNDHLSYSLDACAKRIGEEKLTAMDEWLKKKGHTHANAPTDLIVPYCEQDARLSRILMEREIETFRVWDKSQHPIKYVIPLEMRTTKELFHMERQGFRVDVDYCKQALKYEQFLVEKAKKEFKRLTGLDFVDSAKTFGKAFEGELLSFGRTAKGNISYDKKSLEPHKHNPIVAQIVAHRKALKRASTYWKNLLEFQRDGIIYPNVRQTGAKTSRMSVVDPATQTWPKRGEKEAKYPIRRAVIPSSNDHLILSIDYDQMEFRKIVDESQDKQTADVLKSGRDLHQETADMAKVIRDFAKNGRFAKLYGAGVKKVAETLGVSVGVAQQICDAIDDTSPRVSAYAYELINYVKRAPYGVNWLGRRYYFQPGFEYKYPNYRIQGGCGEIFRFAITTIGPWLREHAPLTRIILLVHDEIVFDIHKSDLHIVPELKRMMIEAQKSKSILDMAVSASIGVNYFDLEEV